MKEKVCFAASLGGHLEEISKLDAIRERYDSFLLTERGEFNELKFCDHVIYVNQINRKERLFVPKFFFLFWVSLWVLLKEKPDIIISSGALVTYPICIWAKLIGKRVIYIESFARVDTPSLTGRLMYRVADLFIVQWQDLLAYFPKAVYAGGIF